MLLFDCVCQEEILTERERENKAATREGGLTPTMRSKRKKVGKPSMAMETKMSERRGLHRETRGVGG